MEISELVDKAGRLEEAKAYSSLELAHDIAAIKLSFQYLSCVISVLEDSDEIVLAECADLSALNESDAKLIFHKCVGHKLVWCWSMVNNQGYSDALKFQFQNNVAVELVVIASAIKQLTVNEL
jgi:hypothetical protein